MQKGSKKLAVNFGERQAFNDISRPRHRHILQTGGVLRCQQALLHLPAFEWPLDPSAGNLHRTAPVAVVQFIQRRHEVAACGGLGLQVQVILARGAAQPRGSGQAASQPALKNASAKGLRLQRRTTSTKGENQS